MSGNAMEEGLILQIHNPSHNDPSRIGFLAGALSGFAFLIGLTIVLPNLPRLLAVYLAIAVATGVGTAVTKHIHATRLRRVADDLIARRLVQQAETERQIQEMHATEAVRRG